MAVFVVAAALAVVLLAADRSPLVPVAGYPDIDHQTKIPADIAKRAPAGDQHPPVLHSPDYEQPVPLPYPVNTAGAEDCPVISPDGNTLYIFFTPDVRVPAEKQLLDGVTGTYASYRSGDTWSVPKLVTQMSKPPLPPGRSEWK